DHSQRRPRPWRVRDPGALARLYVLPVRGRERRPHGLVRGSSRPRSDVRGAPPPGNGVAPTSAAPVVLRGEVPAAKAEESSRPRRRGVPRSHWPPSVRLEGPHGPRRAQRVLEPPGVRPRERPLLPIVAGPPPRGAAYPDSRDSGQGEAIRDPGNPPLRG